MVSSEHCMLRECHTNIHDCHHNPVAFLGSLNFDVLWEHSSRWARIESISAVDNHPYHFLAHPTLPAVSDIHATFATLARCFRCSPYFRNLRTSAHYVAPRANPSLILPIISISFHAALM